MSDNTIEVGEITIEACEDGLVRINGKEIEHFGDINTILHTLIKATIALVQGKD